jgi:hypothetical protein
VTYSLSSSNNNKRMDEVRLNIRLISRRYTRGQNSDYNSAWHQRPKGLLLFFCCLASSNATFSFLQEK